ncbi:MAG: hypothetical protein WCT39_01000, partial [Candidatus Margulisiibacteriota bacterium]
IKVYLKDHASTLSTWSETGGIYSIANIPPGTYEARTDATAVYQVSSKEVTIASGETFPWDFVLQLQPGVSTTGTTLPPF